MGVDQKTRPKYMLSTFNLCVSLYLNWVSLKMGGERYILISKEKTSKQGMLSDIKRNIM